MGRAVAASAGISIANFFYAVCVVAVGYIVIASLYIAVCSAGLGGVAAIAGVILYAGAFNLTAVLMGVFASAALISLCVLGFVGVMQLARLFGRGNMRFLNMTKRIDRRAGQ